MKRCLHLSQMILQLLHLLFQLRQLLLILIAEDTRVERGSDTNDCATSGALDENKLAHV
jgi:hypothetical protein